MADDVTLPASGNVIAADEIAGVKHQRVKVEFGADGSASDVSPTNGLPIAGTQSAPSSTAWTSATVLNTANTITVTGLNTVTVVLVPTTTFTGGVLTFEVSPDGTNWVPIAMARIDSYTVESTYTIVASTNRAWSTSVDGFTNFRVRLSTVIAGTGTATVLIAAQTMPIEPIVTVGQSVAASLQAQINGLTPGTAAANLGKAEDAVHTSGDVGVAMLGVRKDTPTSLASADGDYSNPQVTNLGQLWVVQARPKRVQVASAGLTIATTAYVTGDQVGTLFTFTGMAMATGGGGYIESILLNDESGIIGAYTVWLFRASITPAADNAAFALSDADAQLLIGNPVALSAAVLAVNNSQSGWYGSIPYDCSGGTSIFAALQTGSGHTFFGATTSLKLTLTASVLG